MRHVEEKGMQRRARRLVVAFGQQLLVAAELEGHGARDDALAAPNDLGEYRPPVL